MLPDPPLTDGRVTLRAGRPADVPAIVAMCSEPEVIRFTSVPVPVRRRRRAPVARPAPRPARRRRRRGVRHHRGRRRPPGRIDRGARPARPGLGRDRLPRRRDARGRGLATAALRLIARWTFAELARRAAPAHDPSRQPGLAAGRREGRFTREGVAAGVGRAARRAGRPRHVVAPAGRSDARRRMLACPSSSSTRRWRPGRRTSSRSCTPPPSGRCGTRRRPVPPGGRARSPPAAGSTCAAAERRPRGSASTSRSTRRARSVLRLVEGVGMPFADYRQTIEVAGGRRPDGGDAQARVRRPRRRSS